MRKEAQSIENMQEMRTQKTGEGTEILSLELKKS